MREELRRKPRVKVCCRAVVRDRYGVWMGVTDDLGESGCRIVSPRLLRTGTSVAITLSSDLFHEELEVVGEAAWATSDHLAVKFSAERSAHGRMSPAQFMAKVMEHGSVDARASIVPVVRARPGKPTLLPQVESAGSLPHVEPGRSVLVVANGTSTEHVPFRIPASRA